MNTSPPEVCSDPPAVSRACPQTLLPQGAGNQAPVPPGRSLRILCIDDDEQFLDLMKAWLTRFNHQARMASGAKHGIELFSTAILKSEPYDIVITDLSMPDMDGYQVAKAIKEESPQTPVILMTGMNTTTKEAGLTSSAVNAVISKPPRMQELHDILLRMAG